MQKFLFTNGQELSLQDRPHNIYDYNYAGQSRVDNGEYYILLQDAITKECYAISKANWYKHLETGRRVEGTEFAIIDGCVVTEMTDWEERKYNEDDNYLDVDHWGNVVQTHYVPQDFECPAGMVYSDWLREKENEIKEREEL